MHDVVFSDVAKAWKDYVMTHISPNDYVQPEGWRSHMRQYDLSTLNTFQKVEAMNALARQDAGLPLTLTEKSVLGLLQKLGIL